LFDCALRVDLAGGSERLAEAIGSREWTDHKFRVTWNVSADELRAVVGQ
jgi:hypothetical protein